MPQRKVTSTALLLQNTGVEILPSAAIQEKIHSEKEKKNLILSVDNVTSFNIFTNIVFITAKKETNIKFTKSLIP